MSTIVAPPITSPIAELTSVDRREHPRHEVLQRCFVWLQPRDKDQRLPEGWRCVAYNVSATGIGITLPLQIQLDVCLEIEAWGLPAAARRLRARVVRMAPVEYLWFCGCEFDEPLTEAELLAWTSGPRHWVTE